MSKNLFATVTVEKEEKKKDVKIYKLEDEKYGVEVVSEEDGQTKVNKVENVTKNEEKINKLLDTLIRSVQNFELLDCFAYDYKD